jgi:hypothetical protein
MGQTASQIENHIENKREDLGSNLRELEDKVKSVTDWHRQFKSRPLVFLGLAFGGGAVLASMVGRPSDRRRHFNSGAESRPNWTETNPRTHRAPSRAMEKATVAWENLQGALVGIAAAKVKDYADGIIPGFSEQYRQAEVGNSHSI